MPIQALQAGPLVGRPADLPEQVSYHQTGGLNESSR